MICSPPADHRKGTTDRVEELQELHSLCQRGMLYEVERWIGDERPIQIASNVEIRGHYCSALEIALDTGQHSLCVLLLRSGYSLELERHSPLNFALESRRWDLVDLLLEHGADPHTVDLTTLFDTYRSELFGRFQSFGVDLTEGHELAQALAYHTSNKPLYGFVKRHRHQNPAMQKELDMALDYHVHQDKEKGIMLCLWAGADPHARVRDLEYGSDDDPDEELGTAVDTAVHKGNVAALRRFKPDSAKLDFDRLYKHARSRETVEFLAEIQPPRDLTSIVRSLSCSAGITWDRSGRWKSALLAVLARGIRWEQAETKVLAEIRRDLLRADDWDLKDVLRELGRPEVCSPEIFGELTRTPTMQKRMLEMKLIKPPVKPVSKAEKARREIANFIHRYDRRKLYEDVWSQPVSKVAKSYRVSGVYLGRVCRALRVPVPPVGYWAKLRSGKAVRQPPLRELPKDLLPAWYSTTKQ